MQSSIIDKSNKCYNCNNKINSLSFEICSDCDNIFCDICCEDIFIIRYCNTGSQSGSEVVCCSCVDFDNINQCENCYFWDENMVLFSCSKCEKLICKDCNIAETKKDCICEDCY